MVITRLLDRCETFTNIILGFTVYVYGEKQPKRQIYNYTYMFYTFTKITYNNIYILFIYNNNLKESVR